jgi:RNA polymerase sigma factor, sigma-70 family
MIFAIKTRKTVGETLPEARKNRKLSPGEAVYSGDAVTEPEQGLADGSEGVLPRRASPGPAPQEPSAGGIGAPVHADAVGPTTRVRGGSGVGEQLDDDRGLTFEQIHRKYETKIFNLILRIVGDFDDAQDLTVDTFFNAYRAWDRFRGDSRTYTWLYQIAVNNCKNRFKQRDRRREREPVSLDDAIETDSGELSREVADWSASPERLLLDQEFAERLNRAVEALRPEYRVVFILVELEGLSYEDTARVTELTVPAVKTRLHRARNMIRQRLEPYYRG